MPQYLLLKRLAVQNANALSSPFTYGFPAVTAFLGFAHALQRKLNEQADFKTLQITGVTIACHTLQMQAHQGQYRSTLKITSNPLDKDGNRPSFVEEGRCHLVLSLVLEIENLKNALKDELYEAVIQLLQGRMKLAGGDILPLAQPEQQVSLVDGDAKSLKVLMPSYVLLERCDLMLEAMQSGQDALDALHDALKINYTSQAQGDGKGQWSVQRNLKNQGWIVPLATGFHALTPAAFAEQQRDANTPHRFAEAVVTLGEFKMPLPSRFPKGFKDLMWRYQQQGDLYLCTQNANQDSV